MVSLCTCRSSSKASINATPWGAGERAARAPAASSPRARRDRHVACYDAYRSARTVACHTWEGSKCKVGHLRSGAFPAPRDVCCSAQSGSESSGACVEYALAKSCWLANAFGAARGPLLMTCCAPAAGSCPAQRRSVAQVSLNVHPRTVRFRRSLPRKALQVGLQQVRQAAGRRWGQRLSAPLRRPAGEAPLTSPWDCTARLCAASECMACRLLLFCCRPVVDRHTERCARSPSSRGPSRARSAGSPAPRQREIGLAQQLQRSHRLGPMTAKSFATAVLLRCRLAAGSPWMGCGEQVRVRLPCFRAYPGRWTSWRAAVVHARPRPTPGQRQNDKDMAGATIRALGRSCTRAELRLSLESDRRQLWLSL